MPPFGRGQQALAVLAACVALAAPCVALAESLQVAPIRVDFAAADQTQVLWLSNTGDGPLHAQVRVFAWSQATGKDDLAPTHDLIASPPMVSIAPHGRQLVRLVRLAGLPPPAAGGAEQSYRLLVNEVPTADEKPVTSGLHFLLQYSVPVFLTTQAAAGATAPPAAVDTSHLRVRLHRLPDGHTSLTVSNSGTTHVKISDLSLLDGHGDQHMLVPGLFGYVLAGETMSWPVDLPLTQSIGDARITARFNDETHAQLLHVVDPDD
ncbi:MAG TPA: fimbria/pilus periplasmic chaperone [Paraburkholderia sp.]|jgi:fimbrial chaperone protein